MFNYGSCTGLRLVSRLGDENYVTHATSAIEELVRIKCVGGSLSRGRLTAMFFFMAWGQSLFLSLW